MPDSRDMDEQLVKRVRKLGIIRPHRLEFLEEPLDGVPFPTTGRPAGVSTGRWRGLARLIEDIGFQVGVDAKLQQDFLRDISLGVWTVVGIIVRNEVLDPPAIRPQHREGIIGGTKRWRRLGITWLWHGFLTDVRVFLSAAAHAAWPSSSMRSIARVIPQRGRRE